MKLSLPIDVIAVLQHLTQAGYQAYIVGGSVRDLLIEDQEPTDWDFTTDATPEKIQQLFPESFYENEFGTVAISCRHVREQFNLPQPDNLTTQPPTPNQIINLEEATKIHDSLQIPISQQTPNIQSLTSPVFEITTFRADGIYKDSRRPETVSWGKNIAEDLARRDFTINAIAIQVSVFRFQVSEIKQTTVTIDENDYQVIDPFSGQFDLESRIIKTVNDPHQRFQEDALRMLRAIRFAVQLNFSIEEKTFAAISQHCQLLQNISGERIRDEFLKMLASNSPAEAVLQLDKVGLLQYVLPELLETKGVEQGGHHTENVWEHSIAALQSCPSPDSIVRLATLIHDIAKPRTQRFQGNKITFYNHEVVGARMAKDIARRLKLSKRDVNRLYLLVRHHMFYYQPENTDASIRRFMRRVGLENINDIIDLRIGDRLGSGARETSWRFEEMKKRMQEQLHQPFAVTDLAIDGNDLMTEFNMQPGLQIGKILNTLFEEVVDNPELNEKGKLLKMAKELIDSQ